MKTGLLAGLCALSMTACGGSDDGGGGGSGGGTSEGCSAIVVCDSIPRPHVDQLCGTTTVATNPVDVPNTSEQLNSCEYIDANSDGVVFAGRICYGPSGKGAETAKATYDLRKDDPPSGTDTKTAVAGVGDAAYLVLVTSSTPSQASLVVLDGNDIYEITSIYSAPQTSDGIQAQCLLPLLNEFQAL